MHAAVVAKVVPSSDSCGLFSEIVVVALILLAKQSLLKFAQDAATLLDF